MNQQANMAADAAADLVQQIATKLYGEAGAGVTDLIALANRVQSDMGNPISGDVVLATARRNIRQFIAKASFSSSADRWSAVQCLDVMEAAIDGPQGPSPDGQGDGARWQRLFLAAVEMLTQISLRLGLQPNDDGVQPVLDAIDALAARQPVVTRLPVDGCTESNCQRCRTHPDHRGDMDHAGISHASLPVAVLRFDRGTPGRENEMPHVLSCQRLPDGEYPVYAAPSEQPVGEVIEYQSYHGYGGGQWSTCDKKLYDNGKAFEAKYGAGQMSLYRTLVVGDAAPPAQAVDLGQFIEEIAKQWDGCHYHAVGETIEIGRSIRAIGKRLIDNSKAVQSIALQRFRAAVEWAEDAADCSSHPDHKAHRFSLTELLELIDRQAVGNG